MSNRVFVSAQSGVESGRWQRGSRQREQRVSESMNGKQQDTQRAGAHGRAPGPISQLSWAGGRLLARQLAGHACQSFQAGPAQQAWENRALLFLELFL